MQVAVLNGVNLDAMGDARSQLYEVWASASLETRIYGWARELGCTARCFQTNHEGQYVEWCHDARGWAAGLIVNPGAWSHYSYAIRDALEFCSAPVVEVHLSNIEEREEWRRQSVIADVVDHRIIGKGPRLSRRSPTSRSEREPTHRPLRAQLDGLEAASSSSPSRSTSAISPVYDSSNVASPAAIASSSRPTGATRGGQGAGGRRGVQAERDLPGWIGARLGDLAEGPVAFEADHVTVTGFDSLSQDGTNSFRAPAWSRAFGPSRTRPSSTASGAPPASPTQPTSGSPGGAVGRTEADVAWWLELFSARRAPRRSRSR